MGGNTHTHTHTHTPGGDASGLALFVGLSSFFEVLESSVLFFSVFSFFEVGRFILEGELVAICNNTYIFIYTYIDR